MEQDSTNPNQRPSLDEASRVELRMLLLLDWMMAFDQLHAEKEDLEKINKSTMEHPRETANSGIGKFSGVARGHKSILVI